MENSVNERLKQVIKVSGARSPRAFALRCGIAQSSMADILSGSTDPRCSTLLKILTEVSVISPTWLLMGEGPMLRQMCNPESSNPRIVQNTFNSQNIAQSAGEGSASSGETASLQSLIDEVRALRSEVSGLKAENSRLSTLNEKLTLKLIDL